MFYFIRSLKSTRQAEMEDLERASKTECSSSSESTQSTTAYETSEEESKRENRYSGPCKNFFQRFLKNIGELLMENEEPPLIFPPLSKPSMVPIVTHGHLHIKEHMEKIQNFQNGESCTSSSISLPNSPHSFDVKEMEESTISSSQNGSSSIISVNTEKPLVLSKRDRQLLLLKEYKRKNDQNNTLFYKNEDLIHKYISESQFHVTFDPAHDPEYPRNWDWKIKIRGTLIFAVAAMLAQLGSAVIASIATDLQKEFGVRSILTSLASTIYFLGMAFGPLFLAPLSELWGRKLAVALPFALGSLVTILTGHARNFAVLLVCRFFAGLLASAPIVISGGAISDLWYPGQRATFLTINSLAIVLGPTTAYLYGTIIKKATSWRWVVCIHAFLSALIVLFIILGVRETYHPVLLQRKAKYLRLKTQNWLYHSDHDSLELNAKEILRVHLLRPICLLSTPIVLVVCIFNGFSFGLYYMISMYVPKSFQEERNWDAISSSFPPLAIFIGANCGAVIHLIVGGLNRRKLKKAGGECTPEARLLVPLLIGWFMPFGMILFGWSMTENLHWAVSCLGLMFVGAGFFVILQGSLNYLCDAFPKYSASCIAANAFMRSLFACGIPLVAPFLFEQLGLGWGATTLGFIGFLMTIFVFYIFKYGAKIRTKESLLTHDC
ncbi:uncharacterized protein SAPINGB_P002803 [Magnusiomyces paraingens]|uniref:Major facilitator superfamily (MFS) profile domain-containing protein n=1 Tax=Magnusiomyces paraingens TaxID=2606893 RepID=A0A5E8BIU9_9ASCO|nr:uncharacterized protein SAPINGB_P002803 [Saprochaete ingens]VVT50557.1 unnamed protein product [Saprochaete ingens]